MKKRLNIFLTALIISGLALMPFRSGWAAVPAQASTETPLCHMTMDDGQAMQMGIAALSGSDTMPPCCSDDCDGCNNACGACSPVNVALPFLPMSQANPDNHVIREVASLIPGTPPRPLLRPPTNHHC